MDNQPSKIKNKICAKERELKNAAKQAIDHKILQKNFIESCVLFQYPACLHKQ